MRLIYGFIFYYTMVLIALTIAQVVLLAKPVRHLCFNIARKLQFVNFPIYRLVFWITFLIVASVMVDSIITYNSLQNQLGDLSGYKVDLFESIKTSQREDYLSIYRRLKDYYMAERNFMLTASALAVMFIFNRFLATFRKWYDMEKTFEQTKINGKEAVNTAK